MKSKEYDSHKKIWFMSTCTFFTPWIDVLLWLPFPWFSYLLLFSKLEQRNVLFQRSSRKNINTKLAMQGTRQDMRSRKRSTPFLRHELIHLFFQLFSCILKHNVFKPDIILWQEMEEHLLFFSCFASSFSRSIFILFIPKTDEASFFSFVNDKNMTKGGSFIFYFSCL